MNKTSALKNVCAALASDSAAEAAKIVDRHYPFSPIPATKRKYGAVDLARLFVRDGFINRYSGERLVFSPALRMISVELEDSFPYHRNWKSDATHSAYWDLGATLDHVVPVARGGADEESNWVTTSMARNSAKMNFTIDQLGWTLHPGGDFDEWDGLMRWSVEYGRGKPELLGISTLKTWHRAAKRVLNGG